MPFTSLKQFLDFLKFSFFMPFRLGWSFFGLFCIGSVVIKLMYLYGYSMEVVDGIVSGSILKIYGEPSFPGKLLEFFALFLYEFIWQLWAGYIFIVVFMTVKSLKPNFKSANVIVKQNYATMCLLAVILSILFIMQPTASISLAFREEVYFFHYYMIYAIGILFVFLLIEIIRNEVSIYEAIATSIMMLQGKYIFTFVLLSIALFGMSYFHNTVFSHALSYLYGIEDYTFSQKKMAFIQGAIKALIDTINISIYSGAVIYLYKLYNSQDAEKAA